MKLTLIIATGVFLTANCYAKNPTAQAVLESRSGSKTTGTINFTQKNEILKIEYKVAGLKANSSFGFHIHEKGDCSSLDAKSAGSHFHKIADVGGTSKETPGAFAGDLPQIKSNEKGLAEGFVNATQVSLNKSNSVDGLAIMIHSGPDDVTKPSASRIACGVIKSKLK